MVASISSLDLLLSGMRDRYVCIAQEKDSYAQFATANLPAEHMVLVSDAGEDFSDDAVIQSAMLSDILLRKGMNAFLPSCFTSESINTWAQEHGVTVIAPDPLLQEQLEEKLFFNDVLHREAIPVPESYVLRTNTDVRESLPFPGVLQVPKSWGGLGTYFVDSYEQLQGIFRQEKPVFPLLYRAFVQGHALGVTLLIGGSKTAFSSVRSQLFVPASDGPPLFLGTQWVMRRSLPMKALQQLEQALEQLAGALRALGFRGMANVDCVLTEDEAFLIECNPRQSLCTCQLAQHPELLHGLDAMEEYIACFTRGDISTHAPSIPDTDFEGCVLDLDRYGRVFAGRRIAQPWSVGIYDPMSESEGPSSLRLADLRQEDALIVHTVKVGTILDATTNLGVVLLAQPVADTGSGGILLKKEGRCLLDFVSQLIERSLA